LKISIITLGCDKNRVDSEKMLFNAVNAGHELVEDENAEAIIVNTCAFIDRAKIEAVDTIFAVHKLKETARLKHLIVTGCFAQRYMTSAEFPEVDLFIDIKGENNIAEILNKLDGKKNEAARAEGRITTTPPHYAYLKISDGCDNRCTYCAIPSIRGKYKSESMGELVVQATKLREDGAKELILVAQDTTRYGVDLYGKPSLLDLLKRLCEIDFWKIRVLYAYPELVTDELLTFICENKRMAKYLDIPFQHIDGAVLKKMGRRTTEEALRALTKNLRENFPEIAFRSTFICGFPTEDEAAHKKLVDFVKDGADYAGFFAYSKEEGTPAYDFKPQIKKSVANARVKECEAAAQISLINRQKRLLGKTVEVIYEGADFDKGLLYGRTEFCAPEIDTLVYFTSTSTPQVGEVYNVKITEAGFHLKGVAE